MNDCFALQSYPKCNYEQLRDFLMLPYNRKLQYITSSIDKDQVLGETFDKVQTLQQKNVFFLVDEVQIRPTVSISGGLLSGMAENNRDCKATSILITSTSGLEPLEIPTVFNPRERRMSYGHSCDSSDEEPTHCYWPPLSHPVLPCPPYSDFKAHHPQPSTRFTGDCSPSSISPVQSNEDELPPPYITVSNTHPQPGGDIASPDSPDAQEEPIFANVEIGTSWNVADPQSKNIRCLRRYPPTKTSGIPKLPAPVSPRSRSRHSKSYCKVERPTRRGKEPVEDIKTKSSVKELSTADRRIKENASSIPDQFLQDMRPPRERAPSPPVKGSLSPKRKEFSSTSSSSPIPNTSSTTLSPSRQLSSVSPIPSTSPSHSFCSSLTSVSPHHSAMTSPSHTKTTDVSSPHRSALLTCSTPGNSSLHSESPIRRLSVESHSLTTSNPGTIPSALTSPGTAISPRSPSHYGIPLDTEYDSSFKVTGTASRPPFCEKDSNRTESGEEEVAESSVTDAATADFCSSRSSSSSSSHSSCLRSRMSICSSENLLPGPCSPARPALPPRGVKHKQAPARPSSATKPPPTLPPKGVSAPAPPLPPIKLRRQE
ncbi:hypothetical protein FHG87_006959 [Trinorchestia longiramus]|nr:hypothetical protein FHG87_006959 [Trinorchestia longiramus]